MCVYKITSSKGSGVPFLLHLHQNVPNADIVIIWDIFNYADKVCIHHSTETTDVFLTQFAPASLDKNIWSRNIHVYVPKYATK